MWGWGGAHGASEIVIAFWPGNVKAGNDTAVALFVGYAFLKTLCMNKHRFVLHLVYNVRCSAIRTNSSLFIVSPCMFLE